MPAFTVNVVDCDTVTVTLDDTAVLPVYDVAYRPSNVPVWTTAASFVDASMNNVVTINGLAEATQYIIRARHYCDETNTSLWSEVVVVTPSCEVVSCPTPSYTANAPTCDRINVTLDGTSVNAVYDVEYRLLPNAPWIIAGTAVDATVNPVVAITGLIASQNYEVRVRRVCSSELSSNWIVLGVSTPACPPVCTDPDVRLAQSGCDGIELTAITAVGASNLFEVQYKEASATTWSASIIINGDVNNIYTILGLTQGTSYNIRSRRICGNGLYSNWVTQTFSTALCSSIGDCYEVVVTQQEDTDMSTWLIEATDGGGVNTYAAFVGWTYNAGMGTWTGKVCSTTVPVLVLNSSGTPATIQSITSIILGGVDCASCLNVIE